MNAPSEFPPEDETNPQPQHESPVLLRPRQKFWQRFGGDGFLISLGLHLVVGIVAIFWVVSRFVESTTTEEPTDFTTGTGGGTGGANAKKFEQRIKPKNTRNLVKSQNKLAVKGGKASVALPDMPKMQMSALENAALAGGSSKGLGGGSGGGIGGGSGIGKGGGKNLVTLFGITGSGTQPNAFKGTLYDLKQTREKKARFDFENSGERGEAMKEAFLGLRRNNFKKEYLDSKYFQASTQLNVSRIMIHPLDATIATGPEGFDCENEMKAPGWLAYYEGWITPPQTGEYRFVGAGDDAMMITAAVNNTDKPEIVLWAYWPEQEREKWFKHEKDWEPKGTIKPAERAFGSWIRMQKGRAYKIQIIFAEATGGQFAAEIGIQKKDAKTIAGDNNLPVPMFCLTAPSPEEIEGINKRSTSRNWVMTDIPLFGCEVNGVKPPRTAARR